MKPGGQPSTTNNAPPMTSAAHDRACRGKDTYMMNTSPLWKGGRGLWCVAVKRDDILSVCRAIEDSVQLKHACGGINARLLDDVAATRGYHVIELSTGKADVSIDAWSALIMQHVPIGRSYLQTETRWTSDAARLLVPRYRDIPIAVYAGGCALRVLVVLALLWLLWHT